MGGGLLQCSLHRGKRLFYSHVYGGNYIMRINCFNTQVYLDQSNWINNLFFKRMQQIFINDSLDVWQIIELVSLYSSKTKLVLLTGCKSFFTLLFMLHGYFTEQIQFCNIINNKKYFSVYALWKNLLKILKIQFFYYTLCFIKHQNRILGLVLKTNI